MKQALRTRYTYLTLRLRRAIPTGISYILALLIAFLLSACEQDVKTEEADLDSQALPPVFEKVDPGQSGLVFANRIQENVETLENLFNFDYFYNGAGVGVADLNNDGLLDVFFCGNQVENRLYINKGNLTFEDITETAGINTGKQWSNGVSMVDINSDGWMDIYVSQGGPHPRLQRKNLLYINQKDGTFAESAESYGLADMGISTQSAFFDYDRDGDLDCIVMNENEYYGVDPVQLDALMKRNPEAPYFNSSHLYRNDGGSFTDVSQEAGIQRPIFGLGLSVSDINSDGWLDIYLASDYYLPDALFINQGDGTFEDRIEDYTQQISYYGMGIDIADINNDALQDIFVLDMASSDHYRSKTLMASMNVERFDYLVKTAGYHYQYMYNSLQLNEGNDHFSNIAQLTGMASTDWSWSVLMSDFDLDTDKDIYVTNGYRRYALDNDLQQRVYEARQRYGNNVPMSVKAELYASMPSEKLPNLLFENGDSLSFEEAGARWGLGDLSFSNGSAMGDLDNDGDLDLIVNNMDDTAFLYKNLSREQDRGNYLKVEVTGATSEVFPSVTAFHSGQTQHIEARRVRGYRSSHEPTALFGLGPDTQVDSLKVQWPGGRTLWLTEIAANQSLTITPDQASDAGPSSDMPGTLFEETDAARLGLVAEHRENIYDDFAREILLPYKQSTQGPMIAQGDMNGDGLEDLFIGGASGQPGKLFLRTASGFQPKTSKALQADEVYEDMGAVFFDLEGDGDLDLYVVSGGNAFAQGSSLYWDRIYRNDGNANFTRVDDDAQQVSRDSGKKVVLMDFDADGDHDLVVGNRILAQRYPYHAPSLLLENQNGTLRNVTEEKAPELLDFGIINDLVVTDYDGDGTKDLMVAGEWTSVGFFKVGPEGLRMDPEAGIETPVNGWWFSITETDANADGLPDYVLGNVGHNIKFGARPDKPFRVHATDFDENGTNDIVLSKKYKGEYVPVRGRECSSQQMPFIAEKFPTYSDFANASLQDVYGNSLEASYTREAHSFTSVLLLNEGSGRFKSMDLPVAAQMIPILDAIAMDLDQDGKEDLILAGNIYETEVETPRLDAVSGTVLLSNGNGSYRPMSRKSSGLYINGNVKSLQSLLLGKETLVLAGINNEQVQLWRIRDFNN